MCLKGKIKSLSSPLPPILHISHKHVWATQNSFFFSMHMWTYCTSEHSVVLLPSRSRCWGTGVFVWVCVREGVWKRGENTRHTNALFIPPVSIGLVLITEIESYESNQRFCRVWVKVCEKASGSERECMSFNAISRHLWQSLKGVKFVLGFVGGGCVSNRVYRLLGGEFSCVISPVCVRS